MTYEKNIGTIEIVDCGNEYKITIENGYAMIAKTYCKKSELKEKLAKIYVEFLNDSQPYVDFFIENGVISGRYEGQLNDYCKADNLEYLDNLVGRL